MHQRHLVASRGKQVSAPQLREYQLRAVDAVRKHLRDGKRKVIIVSPTGSGKTVIAAHVMSSALGRGKRVLFMAHRRELINQTVAKLVDAGVPADSIGVLMGDDKRTRSGAPIQVASVDTLRNRDWPAADIVIIDEAHRSLAPTYLEIIGHYAGSGAAVLGLTATPYRADGGGLGDVYEVLEVVATPMELIGHGFIVEPRVFSAPKLDLSNVRVRAGEYHEGDLASVVNSSALVGDIVETWRKRAAGLRTVAFSVSVAHSMNITERFVAAGVPAEHVDGETPTPDRDAILGRLNTGETLVVSNCGVLCEGWDQPAVKCAILARPTKSVGLYLQQAGRILRPWGEQRAIILDHAGNALAHGLPQDDRDLTLEPSVKKRGGAPAKCCSACGAVSPIGATECAECGHVFVAAAPVEPPVEAAGELEEVNAVNIEGMRHAWVELLEWWSKTNAHRVFNGERPMKPGVMWHRFQDRFGCKPPAGCKLPIEIASDEEKAEALRRLRQEASERGYKSGWAVHRFTERFGHRPTERMRYASIGASP